MTFENHRVAIVGGRRETYNKFEENLLDWGIEVVQTQEFLPFRLSSKATAVIVIKSLCSHKLFHTAQLQAGKRRLLFLAVEHNWTQAEPLLVQHGLLEQVTPDEARPVDNGNNAVFSMLATVNAELADLRSQLIELPQLRSRVVEAEDMVLERDLQLDDQQKRLDDLFTAVSDLGDQLEKQAVSHTNTAQRAAAAVALLPQEREAAKRRMHAGRHGNDPDVVTGEALDLAGQRVGLSRETVRKAARISEKAPEIFDAMRRGEIASVAEALRQFNKAQDHQQDPLPKRQHEILTQWASAQENPSNCIHGLPAPIFAFLRFDDEGYPNNTRCNALTQALMKLVNRGLVTWDRSGKGNRFTYRVIVTAQGFKALGWPRGFMESP